MNDSRHMLADFAWDQRAGVWLRRELVAEGFDDRSLRRLVKAGVLHQPRRGAYIDRSVWADLSPEDRHRVTCRAVLMRAKSGSVLSHGSSVIEQGGKVFGFDLREVHLNRVDGRAGRREAGVVQHRALLPATQVRVVNGVPVTSPARAATEMSTLVGLESCLVTTNWFLGHGDMTRAEMREMLAASRHWPRTLHNPLLEMLMDGRNQWPGEARLSYILWRHSVPRPIPQYPVRGLDGALVGIVDFAWPGLGVFLEFDGRIKYERHRRYGESLEQFLLREKQREELIVQLTGWTCIRVTWAQLGQPTQLAGRIMRVLESRRLAA